MKRKRDKENKQIKERANKERLNVFANVTFSILFS